MTLLASVNDPQSCQTHLATQDWSKELSSATQMSSHCHTIITLYPLTLISPPLSQVLQRWELTSVRRWAASTNSFTLDFGDYREGYYSVQTAEGELVSQLLGSYIDLILRAVRLVGNCFCCLSGRKCTYLRDKEYATAYAHQLQHFSKMT